MHVTYSVIQQRTASIIVDTLVQKEALCRKTTSLENINWKKLGRTVDDPFLRVIDVGGFINSPVGTSVERRDGRPMFLGM